MRYGGAHLFALLVPAVALAHVVPGRVFPTYPQTWNMKASTIAMVCNETGPVDAAWGAQWGLTDLDWSGGASRQLVRRLPLRATLGQ